MAHDVDSVRSQPSADALFEYLYHGRNDTERAREAVEHQEKYSFQPESTGSPTRRFQEAKPDEFFDKMQIKKRKTYEEKKPEAKKLNSSKWMRW